jgi:hypothetical protein
MFGSLEPSGRPKRLWLAYLVIALMGVVGVVAVLLIGRG